MLQKVPFSFYAKVLLTKARVTQIFTVLVLSDGFIRIINDILQFWQINFSLFKDDFLEGMNSASDMFPVIDIKLLH